MWLIAPLIFILAWVKSHSVSQSITESAAWCGGYMAVAGVIIALNLGSIHIISEAPDGPGSILPILGGFIFMWVSHMLWRRRGGHLQHRQVPLSRLAGRAYVAFRGTDAAKPASSLGSAATVAKRAAQVAQAAGRSQPKSAPPQRSIQGTPSAARQPPLRKPPSPGTSSPPTVSARSASPARSRKAKKAPDRSKSKSAGRLVAGAGHEIVHSDGAKTAMKNRWFRGSVRAMDALLNDPKKGSKQAK